MSATDPDHAAAVLSALVEDGPSNRAELAAHTKLKPVQVQDAIAELIRTGRVVVDRWAAGRPGSGWTRTAVYFRVVE